MGEVGPGTQTLVRIEFLKNAFLSAALLKDRHGPGAERTDGVNWVDKSRLG